MMASEPEKIEEVSISNLQGPFISALMVGISYIEKLGSKKSDKAFLARIAIVQTAVHEARIVNSELGQQIATLRLAALKAMCSPATDANSYEGVTIKASDEGISRFKAVLGEAVRSMQAVIPEDAPERAIIDKALADIETVPSRADTVIPFIAPGARPK